MTKNLLFFILLFFTHKSFSQTLFSENFQGSIAGWTIYNNTTGSANPNSSNWMLQTSPYFVSGTNYISNDASQFIISNSDAPGFGSITRATMQTPVFSAAGYSTVSLNFYHHFDFADDFDSAVIEVSNNGTTWTQVASYNSSQAISEGVPAGFVNRTINISSIAANQATVSIRFRHRAEWAFVWAMDNITVTGTLALPVKFTSFTGQSENGRNVLSWTTSTEIDNKLFQVERSLDGIKYDAIGRVNSNAPGGNSQVNLDYKFIDANPVGSKQYYRLKQIDIDGKFNYSNIVLLKSSARNISVTGIFPNPVLSEFNLVLHSSARERSRMQVYDIAGRIVIDKYVQLEIGLNSIKAPVHQLKAGTYFSRLLLADGTMESQKFIKQ